MGTRSEIGEFKGHPTITIFTGREYKGREESITLGIRKAEAVCEEIDAIRIFMDQSEGARK